MTTIKLKNGSGAPTAGDLAQGEPALDLTNKRLYTEDSGGTVIEVGVNPTSVTTGDITATGTATFAGLTTTADVSFGDNDKAIFGAGSDLQIYHDGSHSKIEDAGTGDLKFITNGSGFNFQKGSTENLANFAIDGAVTLYYDNSAKLATTSTGIQVGTFSGNSVAQISAGTTGVSSLYLGDGSSGAASYAGFVEYNHTGDYLRLGTGSAERVRVNSTGIDVTGDVVSDGLTVSSSSAGSTSPIVNISNGVDAAPNRQLAISETGGSGFLYKIDSTGASGSFGQLTLATNGTDRININAGGDISFYEDTGTTAKFFWDASAESLGIGTSSIATHLHVQGSSGEIRVQDTGSGGGIVSFRDSGTSSIPSIQSSGNNLLVNTGGSERMRIDSSGNLLVGKTSAGSNNVGAELRPQGYIFGTGDGINPLRLNRQTSDGMIADFQKDGTTVGSIGTASSRVYIGTDDTGLRFTNDEITPFNPSVSADRNGTVDLGGSSTRFKDLYLSGGAYLGGTGSANKLDDYEEGTFTATLKGSTGEPGTLITTTGYYTKIGRDVTYNISFENVNTTGYSGSVSVSGLPFANGFGRHTAAAGVYSLASWTDFVIGVSGQATTTIDLMDIRSGNLWASAQHSAGTTRYLWLSGTYMTTA